MSRTTIVLVSMLALGSMFGGARLNAQQLKRVPRPPAAGPPTVDIRAGARVPAPVLQVARGGGDMTTWGGGTVFQTPEPIRLRWSSTASYHHGQWQISTLPFRFENPPQIGSRAGLSSRVVPRTPQVSAGGGEEEPGGQVADMPVYNAILATGGTGRAPAGGGSIAQFTINTALFAPPSPPERPVNYYVRVVPLDAQNEVAGSASTQVVLRYARPGAPTEFTPEGIYGADELTEAKHSSAPRVRLALARILEALEFLNPEYDTTRDAMDVRGGNYSIFDDEVLEPHPWDTDPVGLMHAAEGWVERARRLAGNGPLVLDGDFDAHDSSVGVAIANIVAEIASGLTDIDVQEWAKKLRENAPAAPGEELFGGSGVPVGPEYWDAMREYVVGKVVVIMVDAEKYIESRP